jgi:Na+-transporting NADH:ubiquinone oxidoreductase subunit A
MSSDIVVKRGLDLKLVGKSALKIAAHKSTSDFSVYPSDFHGVFPKLLVKENDKVKAGDILFFDKNSERVKFASPVSGKISEIVRGERRKVLELKIKADKNISFRKLSKFEDNADSFKEFLLESGLWVFVKQRPYDVIADPNSSPKDIYISGFDSSPLSADYEFITKGYEDKIEIALKYISKLTNGSVNVSIRKETDGFLKKLPGVKVHNVSGPHPSGNLSTIINSISPINKGDVIWTLNLPDLIIIGNAILNSKFNAERTIAICGSSISEPKYYKMIIGSKISSYLKLNEKNSRIISGNVLTGTKISHDGNLRFYSNEITAIPEGNDYDLFGWAKPMFNKFSLSRALTFSWLFPNKKYNLNTNTNGEHRAFVVSGSFEEVFPLNIYPLQILKACMYKDLDEMEALGMYEVAPEDFALTEFICVSKQPHQNIIREGLDLMKKEIG